MTEYLDHCEKFRVAESLHLPALHYILQDFHSNPDIKTIDYPDEFIDDNGEKLLQILFDKSPIKMRMYGSAKELVENLKIFMGFPASHRNFISDRVLYSTTPTIYESLKKKQFICKSDLFPMLQSMVLRSFSENKPKVICTLVMLFLKSKEKLLIGNDEFVRFDQKVFDEIWKEMQGAQKEIDRINHQNTSFKRLEKELTGLNTDQLIAKLKSFIPIALEAEVMKSVGEWLAVQEKSPLVKPEMIPFARAMIFTVARILIKTVQAVIEKRPEMFLPHKGPITLRLFEDNGQQFLIKNEFFDVMKKQIRVGYTAETQKFGTMKWEDVQRKYGHKMKNIEFIRYPITRSKHRATPINLTDPLDEVHSCLPAVDGLLEFLRTLIFELKIFQKYDSQSVIPIEHLLSGTVYLFDPEQDLYFVRGDAVKFLTTVMNIARNTFPELETIIRKSAKEVRNAKKDGFTLQNLKNELAHLNLIVAFPEIQDYAEVVYEHVNRVKKERYLRTCDLYDAIEQCQLICIFERMPHLKKFLHNQGGCGRVVGLKCAMCMDQQKTSEIQKPSVTPAIDSEDVLKPLKLQGPDSTPSFESSTPNALEPFSDSAKNEMQEKLSKLEQELFQKTKENEKLHVANIKLTAENETKSGMIEKLMDKLSIGSPSKSVLELN